MSQPMYVMSFGSYPEKTCCFCSLTTGFGNKLIAHVTRIECTSEGKTKKTLAYAHSECMGSRTFPRKKDDGPVQESGEWVIILNGREIHFPAESPHYHAFIVGKE